MTQLQLEIDLTEWFIEATFIASLIFAAVYIPYYDWRDTLTGKAVTVLVLSIAGALFHSVLIVWHVTRDGAGGFWGEFLIWLSIVSLGGAGLGIILLFYDLLRGIHSESDKKWICKLLMLGRKFPDG